MRYCAMLCAHYRGRAVVSLPSSTIPLGVHFGSLFGSYVVSISMHLIKDPPNNTSASKNMRKPRLGQGGMVLRGSKLKRFW